MAKSHKRDLLEARFSELELTRPFISTDYYWKRFNQLTRTKEILDEHEGMQMSTDDI